MKVTTTEDLKERLLAKVDKSSGCWVWTGAKNNHGYGLLKVTNLNGDLYRKTRYAHRMSYLCFNGEMPDDRCVCHRCDNPICVNPDHLFLGTHKENQEDMDRKGRRVVNTEANMGNNYAGKFVLAEGIPYRSYSEAARHLGISDNTVRKRILKGVEGYAKL